jgi:hypothetical protein
VPDDVAAVDPAVAAAPHRSEEPDDWFPTLTDGGVGTYWAIDLGDLP